MMLTDYEYDFMINDDFYGTNHTTDDNNAVNLNMITFLRIKETPLT